MTKNQNSKTVKKSLSSWFKNVGDKIGITSDKKKRDKNQNVDIMQYEAELDNLYETEDNRDHGQLDLADEELRNNYKEFREFKKF